MIEFYPVRRVSERRKRTSINPLLIKIPERRQKGANFGLKQEFRTIRQRERHRSNRWQSGISGFKQKTKKNQY